MRKTIRVESRPALLTLESEQTRRKGDDGEGQFGGSPEEAGRKKFQAGRAQSIDDDAAPSAFQYVRRVLGASIH